MAEATTGNDLTGANQSTGIISRISTSISNVRRMTADPAVQKSIPLMFGVIVAFAGLVVFFTMQKSDMTTLFASLPESEKALVVQTLKQNGVAHHLIQLLEKLLFQLKIIMNLECCLQVKVYHLQFLMVMTV